MPESTDAVGLTVHVGSRYPALGAWGASRREGMLHPAVAARSVTSHP